MKRVVAICLSLAVAFCGFCLSGCAQQSDESVIRNGMAEELNMIKNIDSEIIDELLEDIPASMQYQTEAMGLNFKDYLIAYFADFDYEIGTVSIDGDEAVVELTLKAKNANDVSEAIAAYTKTLTPAQLSEVRNGFLTGSAPSWFGDGVVEAIKAVPITETEVLEVPVTKNGNTWSYDDAAGDVLEAAIAGQ